MPTVAEPSDLLALADALYGRPLTEFTAARDREAKQLRATDPSLAAQVKSLRKPSTPAWVVNLLVRRDPGQVDEVLALGAALREAAAVLDGEELRALTRQRRQLTAAITTRARRLALDEGVRVSESVAELVEATLTSALLDPTAAAIVRSGLLVGAVRATGVDEVDVAAVLAVPEAVGHRAPAVAADAEGVRPSRGLHLVPDPHAQEKALEAAQKRVDEAERDVEAAHRAIEGADAEIAELTARGLQIQAEIDELRRRTVELEARAEAADDEVSDLLAIRADATDDLRLAVRERDVARAALSGLSEQTGRNGQVGAG